MKTEIVCNTKDEPRIRLTCDTAEEVRLLNTGPNLKSCVRSLEWEPTARNEVSQEEHSNTTDDYGEPLGDPWLPPEGDFELSWSYTFEWDQSAEEHPEPTHEQQLEEFVGMVAKKLDCMNEWHTILETIGDLKRAGSS